ncbi:hypothetical protein [Roseisolibacter sp. H3M3-2]|uniref:hypothetical protein n=1 Tax=Roseisolibacter sp. H3M3-2 TaxID=3031323 RepID=UPI0023DC0C7E|nr:hypothetical protein [Roseisolibacter sp. H3M3-2]MDF1503067.1 hypothetical protein [Roseisolibacter sp. H3M3-2]
MRPTTLPPTLLLAFLPLGAACTRAPQHETPRPGELARLDSTTAARLCTNPDQARAGSAPCELRDQAPAPELRPRGRPLP